MQILDLSSIVLRARIYSNQNQNSSWDPNNTILCLVVLKTKNEAFFKEMLFYIKVMIFIRQAISTPSFPRGN